MKQVAELKQNSPEWHEWRKEGIGASEANIIMGKSKFMTRFQLWEQKVFGKRAEEKKGNFITNKGHRLEEKSRALFEMEMGYDFPDMIAIMQGAEYLRASLDGYCSELDAVWECKFVGQEDFEKVTNGEVLPQYLPQLQHQLMVTGASVNYLFVIADDKEKKENGNVFPYKTAYMPVYPDIIYLKSELVPALKDFWSHVIEKKPVEYTENDVIDLSDHPKMEALIEAYKDAKHSLELFTKREKEIKKEIFKIAKTKKSSFGDITFTNSKSEDKMVFDAKKFEEENDISNYMKIQKGRKTQRINFPKVEA